MKKLERIIAEIERRMIGGDVECYAQDGTVRKIRGNRLLDMFAEVCQGIVKTDTQIVLDSISDNCAGTGNGGAWGFNPIGDGWLGVRPARSETGPTARILQSHRTRWPPRIT